MGIGALSTPIGYATTASGVDYMLVVLKDLRLEHAAVLHLLQGASYRQLLDEVLLTVPGAALSARLCTAETIPLYKPPFILGKVVFAHVMHNPNNTSDEVLQQELLLAGLNA